MGTEFLIASLWAAVLVYWFWTRRPATGDTVGSFRYHLSALSRATPARVVPANRLCVGSGPAPAGHGARSEAASLPAPLMAVALHHKRTELRRRRRDVVVVLVGLVVVSLAAAVVTRSTVALSSQAVTDLALASYMYLLSRTRGHRVAEPFAGAASMGDDAVGGDEAVVDLVAMEGAAPDRDRWVPQVRRAMQERWSLEERWAPVQEAWAGPDHEVASADDTFPGRGPVRALSGGRRRVASYGDFDSYASLALAEAN